MAVKDIIRKYEAQLSQQTGVEIESDYSKEYEKFKKEVSPELNFYEKLAKGVGKTFKIRMGESDRKKIQQNIDEAHLDITPNDASAFSLITFLFALFVSVLISVGIFLIKSGKELAFENFPILIFALLMFVSIFLYYYTSTLPQRLAQRWHLKASSQMVPCILYVVVFMRHTSNLELAIRFASEHLQNPLALDFKKIFWGVEVGKYSTIKESLDAYLEKWRKHSQEFVESFHLIESSLYEPSNQKRISVLEKALTVILDGVHEKMLHYTHEIQAPLTNLYMLGIVLPTLAIALLPLASTLLQGAIRWYHVMILFNILVPCFVFYLTSQLLVKRPGGYGEAELLEQNPDYGSYKSKKPYKIALLMVIPLILIALIPLLFQYTPLPSILGLPSDFTIGDINLFDFKKTNEGVVGPFGPGALLLSIAFPLAIALFFSISYGLKTKKLIQTRNKTKQLEKEFASSVFQLGNRLADGVPAEMAFGRVAESLRGTPTADFFRTVNINIRQAGMSVNNAIFSPTRGAIIYFPSALIRTTMKILVESVKKGLDVASRALMSISQYLKNIHKINERLKDLLADVVSSMKSNMSFLAPVLAGIVVGLGAMITAILNRLKVMLNLGAISEDALIGGFGSVDNIITMFNIDKMIPPYFLQIIVGIYIVEIVYILTQTLVSVESGSDRLKEKSEIAKNMKTSIIIYSIVTLLSIVILMALAQIAVSGLA